MNDELAAKTEDKRIIDFLTKETIEGKITYVQAQEFLEKVWEYSRQRGCDQPCMAFLKRIYLFT